MRQGKILCNLEEDLARRTKYFKRHGKSRQISSSSPDYNRQYKHDCRQRIVQDKDEEIWKNVRPYLSDFETRVIIGNILFGAQGWLEPDETM